MLFQDNYQYVYKNISNSIFSARGFKVNGCVNALLHPKTNNVCATSLSPLITFDTFHRHTCKQSIEGKIILCTCIFFTPFILLF